MNAKLVLPIVLFGLVPGSGLAENLRLASEETSRALWFGENIYRWTDPASGRVETSPQPPPYRIKERQEVGVLPKGKLIQLILDETDPAVRVLMEQRAVREAQEGTRQQAEAAEARRLAEQKRQEMAALEARSQQLAAEQTRLQTAAQAETKPLVEQGQPVKAGAAAVEDEAIRQKMARAESRRDQDPDLRFLLNILDEFKEFDQLASSKPRKYLPIHIDNLKLTQAKLDHYKPAACYDLSMGYLKSWMGYHIDKYREYHANRLNAALQLEGTAGDTLKAFWLKLPDRCGGGWW